MHPGASGAAWDAGFRPVPVIDFSHAGHIADHPGVTANAEYAEVLAADANIGSDAFALVIEDNSMAPEFSPGDKVLVDPGVSPVRGDFVVVSLRRGTAAIFRKHRAVGIDPVEELVPLNDDWPVTRRASSGKIIGTMVEHRRYRRA
jgi:SOS-response transcriptional repressor LexA